jgi:hypothetical protein
MIGALVLILAFYLFTVAVSFGLLKLVWDDLPAWIALIPLGNLALPVWDRYRVPGSVAQRYWQSTNAGAAGYLPGMLASSHDPLDELNREAARNSTLRPPTI